MDNTTLFDKILNHKKSNYHIIANPYLHILGHHPEFLRQYRQSKMGRLWLLTRFKLIVIVRIVHSIFGGRQRHFMQEKNVKSDVLFVSHLTNIQQLSQDEDAYFGNLPSLLLRQGVSSSVALLKHVTVSNQQVLEGWKGGQIPRFVLGTSLDFLSEIKIFFINIVFVAKEFDITTDAFHAIKLGINQLEDG